MCVLCVISEFVQRLSQSLQANASLPLTVIDLSENAIEDRGKHTSLILVFSITIILDPCYNAVIECRHPYRVITRTASY